MISTYENKIEPVDAMSNPEQAVLLLNAMRDELCDRYQEPRRKPRKDCSYFARGGLLIWPAIDPVCCGGFVSVLLFDRDDVCEMKSIYVSPDHRGKGLARQMVQAVEWAAAKKGFRTMWLEAGILQPDARHLYETMGYVRIPNYGEHAGREDQFCYEKDL